MNWFKFLLICVIFLFGCSGGNNVRDILPRTSFLKVEKSLLVTFCNPQNPTQCVKKGFGATGSGVVVANIETGSYALTAAHVCDDKRARKITQQGKSYKLDFKVKDLYNVVYRVEVVSIDSINDLCIIFVQGLKQPAISIASVAPTPGDRTYNLAAPMGIFDTEMVPIFEGFYNGNSNGWSLYSLAVKGGSSGSPIINHRGELVGMVSQAFYHFSHICISPQYEPTINFIRAVVEKDKYKRLPTILGKLKSIFQTKKIKHFHKNP